MKNPISALIVLANVRASGEREASSSRSGKDNATGCAGMGERQKVFRRKEILPTKGSGDTRENELYVRR